eukprot:4930467-Lingulodinium_polyedra.AAC.1
MACSAQAIRGGAQEVARIAARTVGVVAEPPLGTTPDAAREPVVPMAVAAQALDPPPLEHSERQR